MFSTVGFGDITAKTETARLVVTGQMIAALIFLGVGIKLIVGAVGGGNSGSHKTPGRIAMSQLARGSHSTTSRLPCLAVERNGSSDTPRATVRPPRSVTDSTALKFGSVLTDTPVIRHCDRS